MMCGGFTSGREISPDEQQLILSMREETEQYVDRQFEMFEPLTLKSQVVAGVNYMVKVQIAPEEYIHVKIYKPLPHTQKAPSISEVHQGKTLEDEL